MTQAECIKKEGQSTMFAMKSSDWRELAAYRATGMTPEQVTQMQQYTTDPAPLPLTDSDTPTAEEFWDDK